MFSCSFVRLSVLAVVRLYQTGEHDILETKKTDFDGNWRKWSTWSGHETINLGGQEVTDQCHTRRKIDLEELAETSFSTIWVE